MNPYKNFQTLLQDLQNDLKIINGLVPDTFVFSPSDKKYTIQRRVNEKWELISLAQYRNSEDLILVETDDFAFCVSRWNPTYTISEQITNSCGQYAI